MEQTGPLDLEMQGSQVEGQSELQLKPVVVLEDGTVVVNEQGKVNKN
jgi:hypothetical protein